MPTTELERLEKQAQEMGLLNPFTAEADIHTASTWPDIEIEFAEPREGPVLVRERKPPRDGDPGKNKACA